MDKAKLITIILEAPEDRWNAIINAAKGEGRPRPILPKQAAKILGVCRRSLARYEKRGLLTPIRISSKKIRYDAREVERLATGESVEATA